MRPIEDFIQKRPSEQRALFGFLHEQFEKAGLSGRLSYGIPFYHGRKWVCYLNPSHDLGLELAFTRADEFDDPTGLLKARNRKRIKGLMLRPDEDIPWEAIQSILAKAIDLDKKSKS